MLRTFLSFVFFLFSGWRQYIPIIGVLPNILIIIWMFFKNENWNSSLLDKKKKSYIGNNCFEYTFRASKTQPNSCYIVIMYQDSWVSDLRYLSPIYNHFWDQLPFCFLKLLFWIWQSWTVLPQHSLFDCPWLCCSIPSSDLVASDNTKWLWDCIYLWGQRYTCLSTSCPEFPPWGEK